jgi:hypothetical protein
MTVLLVVNDQFLSQQADRMVRFRYGSVEPEGRNGAGSV